jgi:hypothetical protein
MLLLASRLKRPFLLLQQSMHQQLLLQVTLSWC